MPIPHPRINIGGQIPTLITDGLAEESAADIHKLTVELSVLTMPKDTQNTLIDHVLAYSPRSQYHHNFAIQIACVVNERLIDSSPTSPVQLLLLCGTCLIIRLHIALKLS